MLADKKTLNESNIFATVKCIVVGDSGVGKSCLVQRFVFNTFRKEHDLTLGVGFGAKWIKVNDLDLKIHIWDTAGQEKFNSITRSYYRGVALCLIVFDLCSRYSFENTMKWWSDATKHAPPNVVFSLVGIKSDMQSKIVSEREGREFAAKMNASYYETSAVNDCNVNKVFLEPLHNVIQYFKDTGVCKREHGCYVQTLPCEQRSCCSL